jgi:hypothetical protein
VPGGPLIGNGLQIFPGKKTGVLIGGGYCKFHVCLPLYVFFFSGNHRHRNSCAVCALFLFQQQDGEVGRLAGQAYTLPPAASSSSIPYQGAQQRSSDFDSSPSAQTGRQGRRCAGTFKSGGEGSMGDAAGDDNIFAEGVVLD